MVITLIIHADVSKEIGHRLVIVDSPNSLYQHSTDVHCLYLVTLHLLYLMGHCVCYNNLYKYTENKAML